jgi:hypothetical protein
MVAPRDFQIPGENMMYALLPNSGFVELGLSDAGVRISFEFGHKDLIVNAWQGAPPELQVMLGTARIDASLINFNKFTLNELQRLSQGGPAVVGQVARAGARLANNIGLYLSGNNLAGIYIAAPVNSGLPIHFPAVYLVAPPFSYPLGTDAEVVPVQFRAIPWLGTSGGSPLDPWGGGTGALGATLFDRSS